MVAVELVVGFVSFPLSLTTSRRAVFGALSVKTLLLLQLPLLQEKVLLDEIRNFSGRFLVFGIFLFLFFILE